MTVTLTDTFDNASGEFVNYDAYDPAIRTDIQGLKHRDLRNLHQNDVTTVEGIYALNLDSMSDLDLIEVGTIGSVKTVTAGEHWTGATIAVDPAYANFPILSIVASGAGTFVAQSSAAPVDLLNDFGDNDYISVALPSFPASSLNLATSTIFLGDGTNTASVPFSATLVVLTTGHSELRLHRSQFTGIDLAAVTLVGFSIVATAACTVRVMAIRLLSQTWMLAGIDLETRYGRLHRPAPWNGDVTSAADFTQPILWRSTDPPSADDPRPIDAGVQVIFNTGSMTQANTFALYFREVTEDFMTQLDLDSEAMAVLDGHEQPDLGEALFYTREQTDIEPFTQAQIDTAQQFDLERAPDTVASAYIKFELQWSPSGSEHLYIRNSEDQGVTVTAPTLSANTTYMLVANLVDNDFSVLIYEVDDSGNIGTEVYSASGSSDFYYKRRKGRFGWLANLTDGDAYIESIQPQLLNFNEYRSAPILSNTPVIGAELFVTTSPNLEQFSTFVPGPLNVASASVVVRDSARSTSGSAWRIDSFGTNGFQGVESNLFTLDDIANTEIEFDLYYPSAAVLAGSLPQAYLQDDKKLRLLQLSMPTIIPDQWQRVRLLASTLNLVPSGRYSLLIVQQSAFQSSWWVDNPTISSRTVTWDGRAVIEDAWASNAALCKWVPFRNVLNRQGGGILFQTRGNQLQIRAKAVRQDGSISRVQVIPKYAELGRVS